MKSKLRALNPIVDRMEKLYRLIIYTRVYVGIGSAFLVYALSVLSGFNFSFNIGLAVFASVFAVYAMNRKSDIEEDEANLEFGGSRLAERTYQVGILALFVSLVAAYLVNYYVLGAVLAFLALLSAYSFRLLPSSLPYNRLKEIPFVKNIVVGSGLGFIWILGYLAQEPSSISYLALGLFFFLGLRVFIGSVIPDIRDIEGDKKAGIKTIPVIFGESWTKKFLLVINLLATIIYFSMVYAGILPLFAVLAGIVNLPTFLLIIKTHQNNADRMTLITEINTLFTFGILLLLGALI